MTDSGEGTSSTPSTGSQMPEPIDGRSLNLPNLITLSRLGLAVILFWLIYVEGFWISAAVLFVVAAATDAIDGYIARKYGQDTTLGRILDPFGSQFLDGDVRDRARDVCHRATVIPRTERERLFRSVHRQGENGVAVRGHHHEPALAQPGSWQPDVQLLSKHRAVGRRGRDTLQWPDLRNPRLPDAPPEKVAGIVEMQGGHRSPACVINGGQCSPYADGNFRKNLLKPQ